MSRGVIIVGLIIVVCHGALRAADAPVAGKTGTYSVTFTERSPLTTPKERAVRMGQKPPPADYDLAKSEFLVVVPDSYDPAKPMGLMVLNNYKDTVDPPMPVLDLLAQQNMAFITLKKKDTPWDEKCGATVDSVHNMQQLYKIDPTRVYLFAFDDQQDGPRLMVGYPDVFAATYICEFFRLWKDIPTGNNRHISASIAVPSAKYLGLAKAQPVVLSTYEDSDIAKGALKGYRAEGFKNVIYLNVTHDDVHYPNYTKPWLEKVLAYFDEKRVKPKAAVTKPATKATTRPAK